MASHAQSFLFPTAIRCRESLWNTVLHELVAFHVGIVLQKGSYTFAISSERPEEETCMEVLIVSHGTVIGPPCNRPHRVMEA